MSKYYVVYNGDKPADCRHYNVDKSFNNSKFDNIYDAATYMCCWAFPISWDNAKKMAKELVDSGDIKPNKVIDMGMGEITVLMKIVEIEE